jgi:hypothetical protein
VVALKLPTGEGSDASAESSRDGSEENFDDSALSLLEAMEFELDSIAHDEAPNNLAIHQCLDRVRVSGCEMMMMMR